MYGAEAVILTLSQALNQAGHSSSIGAFTSSQQPNLALRTAAEHAGVRVDSILCAGQLDHNMPRALRALVRSLKVDVVHAHGYKADVYAWLAMRGTGVPFVSTCHNWIANDLSVKVYGVIDRWVLRHFVVVVAVSEDVRQQLLRSGVGSERIRLIFNGVNSAAFPMIQPEMRQGVLRVGLAGRLSFEKGVDLFLQAAARVLRIFPETQFVVVGDGPDREKLEALVQELGVSAQVQLAGRCEDMPAFYKSLDVLVSSSRTEGLPIALLEAMASALPLVATRVGEVPQLIQHGVTGLLIPVEDVPALADAIETMLGDAERRRKFGHAGRQRILDQYSAERMTEAYLHLYEDALSKGASLKRKLL